MPFDLTSAANLADTSLRGTGPSIGNEYQPAAYSTEGSPFYQLGGWLSHAVPWKSVGAPVRWAQNKLNLSPAWAGASWGAAAGVPVAAVSYLLNKWRGTENPGWKALQDGGLVGLGAGAAGAGLSWAGHNRQQVQDWNSKLRQHYGEFSEGIKSNSKRWSTMPAQRYKKAAMYQAPGVSAFQQMVYDDPDLSYVQKQTAAGVVAGLSPDQLAGLSRFLAEAVGTSAGVAIALYLSKYLGIGTTLLGGALGGLAGYGLSGGFSPGQPSNHNLFGVRY